MHKNIYRLRQLTVSQLIVKCIDTGLWGSESKMYLINMHNMSLWVNAYK